MQGNKSLNFLFVDRSFCGLDKLINLRYGGGGSTKGFKGISSYEMYSDQNYIDSKGFKIVAQDSQDSVIPTLCGLKNGITQRLISMSNEQSSISLKDATDFLEGYEYIENTRKELSVIGKYYNLKERNSSSMHVNNNFQQIKYLK